MPGRWSWDVTQRTQARDHHPTTAHNAQFASSSVKFAIRTVKAKKNKFRDRLLARNSPYLLTAYFCPKTPQALHL